MPENPIIARMHDAERRNVETKIRKLERRLAEVEELVVGPMDSGEAESLTLAITEALIEAMVSQYRQAADFFQGRTNTHLQVEVTERSKHRSVVLLKRAIRSLQERLDDELAHAASSPPTASRNVALAGRARAGSAMAGSMSVGAGVAPIGEFRVGEQLSAVAASKAFDLLMARVALLESALANPRPRQDVPIGPGHNGAPEFEPPFEESEIREFVALLKDQGPTTPTDLPKLLSASKDADAKVSKLAEYADAFASAAVKGAGGELGKRMAQLPWWLAVGSALHSVVQALIGWIGTLPH